MGKALEEIGIEETGCAKQSGKNAIGVSVNRAASERNERYELIV